MSRVAIALGASLTVLAIAIVLTLAHAPMTVARANGVPKQEEVIAFTSHGAAYCQAGELLPKGTAALRLSLSVVTGPRISLSVRSAGRIMTSGVRAAGWTGRVVTVPVKPLTHTVSDATVCASFQLRHESLIVFGKQSSKATAAHNGRQALYGRMWIEYLRPGTSSWASSIASIARHMGLARADEGTWIAFLALALTLAVAVLASGLILKESA
jgi:hypothetical protein